MTNENYYIDKVKFYDEIVKWKQKCKEAREQGKEIPKLTNYLGDCINKIAYKMSYNPNFINYSFKEDMIGDGIETCLKYFDNYDLDDPKKNPFGYFSMIMWNSFVQRIVLEEKNRYITYKNFEKFMILGGQSEFLVDEENGLIANKLYDNISDFIKNYEEKIAKKKQKRMDKKREKEQKNAIAITSPDSGFDIEVEGSVGDSLY